MEVGLYSQASHGQGGHIDTATGRFYSDSGGMFMVTGTFHVKTEVLVVPGECWEHTKTESEPEYPWFDFRSQKETKEEVF